MTAYKRTGIKALLSERVALDQLCKWSGPAFSLRSVLSTGALLRRQLALKKKLKFVRVRMRFIRVRVGTSGLKLCGRQQRVNLRFAKLLHIIN